MGFFSKLADIVSGSTDRSGNNQSNPVQSTQPAHTTPRSIDPSAESIVYDIYCTVGSCIHWVENSTNAEKFFSNYDLLIQSLTRLTNIQYPYYQPYPKDELRSYRDREQTLIQDFIKRGYHSSIDKAGKLKTVTAQQKVLDNFFKSLDFYSTRFSSETVSLVRNLQDKKPDYSEQNPYKIKNIVFDEQRETILLRTLREAKSAQEAHTVLISIIQFYYQYRDLGEKYINLCIRYCNEDIKMVKKVNLEYREELKQLYSDLRGAALEEKLSTSRNSTPSPGFKRLCIIYFNRHEYTKAIEIAESAISYGHNIAYFEKTIERCEKKLNQYSADESNASYTTETRTQPTATHGIENISNEIKRISEGKVIECHFIEEDRPDCLRIHIYSSGNQKAAIVKIMKSDLSIEARKFTNGVPSTHMLSSVSELSGLL